MEKEIDIGRKVTIKRNVEDGFHEEIIVEVLSRLPVKSLNRFKFICKYCYALIESSTFILKHLKENYDDNNKRLFACYKENKETKYALHLDETLRDSLSYQVFKHEESCPKQMVCGPYYGLFLWYHLYGKCLFLWNIASRELKALPKPIDISSEEPQIDICELTTGV